MPNEQGKIYLIYGAKNSKRAENGVDIKRKFSKDDHVEVVDSYIDAIINTLHSNQEIMATEESWQKFGMNFADYMDEKSKTELDLWKQFQTSSRKFKELHLENMMKRQEIVKGFKSYDEKLKERLNDVLGKITIDTVKNNKELVLFFYYDPKTELAELVADEAGTGRMSESIRDLLENIENYLLGQEENYANAEEGNYGFLDAENPFVVNMRYLYQNKEQLKGRVKLFDCYGNIYEKMPWEKEELKKVWEEGQRIKLTPVRRSKQKKLKILNRIIRKSEKKRNELKKIKTIIKTDKRTEKNISNLSREVIEK